MIRLTLLNNGVCEVSCPSYGVYVKGPLASVKQALAFCGVNDSEVAYALEQLVATQDTAAVFGINKMFIHTTRRAISEVA